jgi:hypothetical protein
VLHASRPLTLEIEDPDGIPADYRLAVRYNGIDVTRSFLLQSAVHTSKQGTQLRIEASAVRLFPETAHDIEVMYIGAPGHSAIAHYSPPLCHFFESGAIRTTEDFAPENGLVERIADISHEEGINPAFTAALIAQESGFKSRRVSWARAVGLTQVTPIAEPEVAEQFSAWPRYPGLNDLPLPLLKILISSGRANSGNEWRLNPEFSIRGGLVLAHSLAERWSRPDALALIRNSYVDPETAFTQLVLASYNSGYTRVATALARDGSSWLSAPELREARHYANQIISYCDHFSAGEGPI